MNKYRNKTDYRGKIRFDSQKEAARYDELILLLKTGKIRFLKLQPEFTLQEAFITPDGEKSQAIKYRADFSYEIRANDKWEFVVEDVKGVKTQLYLMKRKMMLDKGIRITEV